MRILKNVGVLSSAALLALSTACMNSDKKPDPETIEGKFEIIWDAGSGLSPDIYAIQPLKSKFPNAEFHLTSMSRGYFEVGGAYPNENYEIVEKDTAGDLVMIESTMAPYFFKTGYLEPLDNNVSSDLNVTEHLNPQLLDKVREQGKGRIYGVPFGRNVYALYYNEEIFKELNVPLPTDGMTWDDVFERARLLAQSPLLGARAALRIPDNNLVYSQFNLRIIDSDTGQPDADSPLWEKGKAFFDKYLELYNSTPLDGGTTAKSDFDFFSEGKVAMVAGAFLGTGTNSRANAGLLPPFGKKWDMVDFPVFADAPDTGPAPSYYYLGIPKNSQHKNEAYRMISYLLSNEPQSGNSRNGLASVLNDPGINGAFGESSPFLSGKQVKAYFQHPKEGSSGPDYDWEMQKWGSNFFFPEDQAIVKMMDYRRSRLEKVGAASP